MFKRSLPFLAIAAWLFTWIWLSRFAMLDDALIHLRYASFLFTTHHITYDGVHPSYGTSSILYVGLLAVLRSITGSALLPKIVSVVFYVALVALLLHYGRLFRKEAATRWIWIGLLVSLLSPMGIRWLTDGMETSLTLLLVAFLALLSGRLCDREITLRDQALLGVLAVFLVAVRVEIASLIALAGVVLAVCFPATTKRPWSRPLGLWCGASLSLLAIRFSMGSVLPDTALAKTGVGSLNPLREMAHVTCSSFVLGIGLSLLFLWSAWLAFQRIRQCRLRSAWLVGWAAANGIYPLLIAGACLRGQTIQGVRYILWPQLFSILWNLRILSQLPQAEEERAQRLRRAMASCYVVVIVLLAPFDWYYAQLTMSGRSKTFLEMRDANLQQLQGETLIAADVGFIGYFSRANICDIDGLVDGRAVARMDWDERAMRCAAAHPSALFLDPPQVAKMAPLIDLSHWSTCGSIAFQNVRGDDRHTLMIRDPHEGSCPI
ncbi:MAG TPA: hypothetical protein VHX11_09830 [Acidobacteriaceae bacterium]|nr:hypothetical protein [Acidobacteriaceae bacterium]